MSCRAMLMKIASGNIASRLFARQFTKVACMNWEGRTSCSVTCSIKNAGLNHRSFQRTGSAGLSSESSTLANSAVQTRQEQVTVQSQMDFFGEPVAFLSIDSASPEQVSLLGPTMAALDLCIVATVTKGSSCKDGGDEVGIPTQAAHSAAIVWADLLKHAAAWNNSASSAMIPMLAVAAVAPLLAQTGVGYVRHIDLLFSRSSQPSVQMLAIAKAAVSKQDHQDLSPRERWHLQALSCLLKNDHRSALTILLKLLQQCPGDALALSLAIDIASTLGDKEAAMRAAGSVAAYWYERGGSGVRKHISGYSIGASWIALGFAVGGRSDYAERLAERTKDQDGCGGIASWALAHVYDMEGRTSEGISYLAGFDGVQAYESCGLGFFDSRLGGYGARFSLDREGFGQGRTALRIYDTNFDRILHYSGFSAGLPWKEPSRIAPKTRSERYEKSAKSMFQRFFGGVDQTNINPTVALTAISDDNASEVSLEKANLADVLTWMPPTPQILTEATLLLLRLTINGTVATNDARWSSLRHAWASLKNVCQPYSEEEVSSLKFYPLAHISSFLLSSDESQELKEHRGSQNGMEAGMQLMGKLMCLGFGGEMKENDLDEGTKRQWARVVELLSTCLGQTNNSSASNYNLQAWEMDARPIAEQAICYAACLSEDYDSLCIARSICSKGVCLRTNSPEEWWRYSVVLDLMGDEIAAEDARVNSVSLGSGEGGKGNAA